jgi:hypothetical protein
LKHGCAFDDELVCEFIDLWNDGNDGQPPYSADLAWNFIYDNIFLTYDMLYPVMQQFVDLGSQEAVQGAITTILTATAASGVAGSTLYMPITRELSAGARQVLQVWGGLVEANFPQKPLQKPPNCGQTAGAGSQGRRRRTLRTGR